MIVTAKTSEAGHQRYCRHERVVSGLKAGCGGLLPPVKKLRRLIHSHRVQMIGPVRQEILAGIRSNSQFKKLSERLESFPDQPLLTEDNFTAAQLCRLRGIRGSNMVFLVRAVAFRNKFSIFTADKEFERHAGHLKIMLHKAA